MDEKIKLFLQIRKHLRKDLSNSLQVYYCDIWDPCCEFIVQKEVTKIVKRLVEYEYPDVPKELFPQFIFRRPEDLREKFMDMMIQHYYNGEKKLKYLGSPVIDDHIHDVYIKPSLFLMDDYRLVVKYGHDDDHYIDGGEQAEVEYYNGIRSPLSIAYQIALDAGEV